MTTSNLPAVRVTNAVAVPADHKPESPQPARNPLSGDLLLLTVVGGILTGSAAWSQMPYPAIGLGAGTVALAVATRAVHRHETRTVTEGAGG